MPESIKRVLGDNVGDRITLKELFYTLFTWATNKYRERFDYLSLAADGIIFTLKSDEDLTKFLISYCNPIFSDAYDGGRKFEINYTKELGSLIN